MYFKQETNKTPENTKHHISHHTKKVRITNGMKLDWLPVSNRIIFKIHTVTYKAKQVGQPVYISLYLQSYTSIYSTRHRNLSILNISRYTSLTPTSYNLLPTNCRTAILSNSICSDLKTNLC